MVRHAGSWPYFLVLTVMMLKHSVGVGPFVPGITTAVGAGYLVGSGVLNLLLVYLVCVVGALIGDSLSFLVGRRKLYKGAVGLQYSDMLQQARKYLLLYQFNSLSRYAVPIAAGLGGMAFKSWLSTRSLPSSAAFVATLIVLGVALAVVASSAGAVVGFTLVVTIVLVTPAAAYVLGRAVHQFAGSDRG